MPFSTIWKFQLPLARPDKHSTFLVPMPVGARVLSADFQGGSLYVWAEVDPDAASELRRIAVVGTGHLSTVEILTSRFVGTVFFKELVFHVFDLGAEL